MMLSSSPYEEGLVTRPAAVTVGLAVALGLADAVSVGVTVAVGVAVAVADAVAVASGSRYAVLPEVQAAGPSRFAGRDFRLSARLDRPRPWFRLFRSP